MDSLSEVYCLHAYGALKPLHANWPPSQNIELGDYGERRGATFVRLGSITQLGISVDRRQSQQGQSQFSFSRGANTAIAAGGAADAVGAAVATLNVEFTSEYSIFLNAAGCRIETVDSKVELGKRLIAESSFDRNWVVVTDIVHAQSFTLAISEGKGGKLSLQAENKGAIDLANGSVHLNCQHREKIGYIDIGQRNRTPFIGLCGISTQFFTGKTKLKVFSDGWSGESQQSEADKERFIQID